MRLAALWTLVRRDLTRARGALMTSGFGIAAGTAALVFFLALGLGVEAVLLGEVFPIDQIELEPPKGKDPGLLGGALGFGSKPPGVSEETVQKLRDSPLVEAVYPKLRMRFPASGHGELFGRRLGTPEMVADGIDPKLVAGELADSPIPFRDPLDPNGKVCKTTEECGGMQYCEGPAKGEGICSDPVPVLVSRYLVEFFDKTIAPAHGLPPMGETIVEQTKNAVFKLWLGQSGLGRAFESDKAGPRHVHIQVAGISPRAIDIGITLPLEVVRRWNREFSGDAAASEYSSVLVKVRDKSRVGDLIAAAEPLGLFPKDTNARDVSLLLSGIMALLALVAGIILVVSASNIAYTFRVLVGDRRREIALYRALGASAGDMFRWMMGLAATVGLVGGAVGVLLAWLLSLGADHLAATRLPDFPFKPDSFFAFPPELVLGGLGFAALFALLGALGPARRAGKVDPAAALAHV
ncbi:MAG: ABC transporter permease [Myxococcales bacterium]|nr:ABC transporter permease [Myxococcales bacterium]